MIDRPDRKPWDRLEGESSKAHAAFLVFRDLGPGRTLSEAYRRHTGRSDAKQPGGRIKEWARRFDWQGRVDAWDRRAELARYEGVLKASERSGEDWETRRREGLERAYRAGCMMLEKADAISRFPVERVSQDEKGRVVIEPVGARELLAAATTAVRAFEMLLSVFAMAMPDASVIPIDPDTGQPFDPNVCSDRVKLRTFIESGGKRVV